MDALKKFFPYSFGAKSVVNMLVKILLYIIVGAIIGAVIGIFGKIPLIGILASIVGWIVELYVFVGVVLTILNFLKIVK